MMNPGALEESAKTAGVLVQSLQSTPVILALVVFNIFYIASSAWFQMKQGERFSEVQAVWQKQISESQTTWERLVEKTMDRCMKEVPK